MTTGAPITISPDGYISGSGRIASQRVDNTGRISSHAEELIIDTVEPIDLDGPSDFGELSASFSKLRVTAAACPPVTIFRSHFDFDIGGSFEMEAGTFVLAPEGTAALGGSGRFIAPSLSVTGTLESGIVAQGNGGGILETHVSFASGGTTVMHGDLTIVGRATIQNGTTFTDEVLGGALIITEGSTLDGETGMLGLLRVENSGTTDPGLPVGKLQINGDYTQSAVGTLAIEIGGTEDGDFDELDVTAIALLNGTLRATLIDDFVPQEGDEFDVVHASVVVGAFAATEMPQLPVGLAWEVDYSASNRVRLTVVEDDTPACTGDINGDGFVNAIELLAMLGAWGPCPGGCDADLNEDGIVDAIDLLRCMGRMPLIANCHHDSLTVPELTRARSSFRPSC